MEEINIYLRNLLINLKISKTLPSLVSPLMDVIILREIHRVYIDDRVINHIKNNNINYKKYIRETNTYFLHKETKV